MKGFLGAYNDDVFLFVGPLDGKLGLSKNYGCFTLKSYLFWGVFSGRNWSASSYHRVTSDEFFPWNAGCLKDINAVVSPFRPMGGEFSFYLDLPSWKRTCPLRMRFWVDDFPNFPRWDMWSFWCGIMCTFDRFLTPDKSEHNSEFTD